MNAIKAVLTLVAIVAFAGCVPETDFYFVNGGADSVEIICTVSGKVARYEFAPRTGGGGYGCLEDFIVISGGRRQSLETSRKRQISRSKEGVWWIVNGEIEFLSVRETNFRYRRMGF